MLQGPDPWREGHGDPWTGGSLLSGDLVDYRGPWVGLGVWLIEICVLRGGWASTEDTQEAP